jgi:hypothetical protein
MQIFPGRFMTVGFARLALVAGLLVGSAPSSRAEDNAPFRTAVSFTGGLSVGSLGGPGDFGGGLERFGFGRRDSGAGLAVGGSISRDVTPRLTVEANGAYLDRHSGGWSADAGLRLNLVPASRSLVPYFAVSGGVIGGNSGRIDVSGLEQTGQDLRTFLQSHMMQPGRIGDVMAAVTTAMQQMDNHGAGGNYTNGMLTMGGGVRFDAGPHVFVRPDARAQLVFSHNARVLGLFTLNFGYRF